MKRESILVGAHSMHVPSRFRSGFSSEKRLFKRTAGCNLVTKLQLAFVYRIEMVAVLDSNSYFLITYYLFT